jgi:hypothetical protein
MLNQQIITFSEQTVNTHSNYHVDIQRQIVCAEVPLKGRLDVWRNIELRFESAILNTQCSLCATKLMKNEIETKSLQSILNVLS